MIWQTLADAANGSFAAPGRGTAFPNPFRKAAPLRRLYRILHRVHRVLPSLPRPPSCIHIGLGSGPALMHKSGEGRGSKAGDADFQAKLRGLVETDLRYAAAIGSAAAELSGLSSVRAAKLRVHAVAAHAPEASKRVAVARKSPRWTRSLPPSKPKLRRPSTTPLSKRAWRRPSIFPHILGVNDAHNCRKPNRRTDRMACRVVAQRRVALR